MDPLELKLKRALERGDPPDGFADRVMARVQADKRMPARPAERLPWRTLWFRPAWRLGLAGALAVALIAGGIGYRQRQQRIRAEKARADLMTALQITGTQLHRVRNILIVPPRGQREVRQ